jgi:hypothetical protein
MYSLVLDRAINAARCADCRTPWQQGDEFVFRNGPKGSGSDRICVLCGQQDASNGKGRWESKRSSPPAKTEGEAAVISRSELPATITRDDALLKTIAENVSYILALTDPLEPVVLDAAQFKQLTNESLGPIAVKLEQFALRFTALENAVKELAAMQSTILNRLQIKELMVDQWKNLEKRLDVLEFYNQQDDGESDNVVEFRAASASEF